MQTAPTNILDKEKKGGVMMLEKILHMKQKPSCVPEKSTIYIYGKRKIGIKRNDLPANY